MEGKQFQADIDGKKFFQIPSKHGCSVQYALHILEEYSQECCGKCVFCREGLYQLQELFRGMAEKRSHSEDEYMAEKIAGVMKEYSSCDMGKSAGDFMLTMLQQYGEEIGQHSKRKGCPAGQCSAYVVYYIDPLLCQGCGDCLDICPKDCIEGKKKYISMISEYDCTRCGICHESCKNGAIKMTAERLPKLPDKLTKVGRFKK